MMRRQKAQKNMRKARKVTKMAIPVPKVAIPQATDTTYGPGQLDLKIG